MSSQARSRAAADDGPSVGWMLGMSSWMLLTVIPGPILTWLGFSIIGVISRSARLIMLGVVWGAAAILATLDIWGQWRPLVQAIVYLAGMLVALMVNPGWLRTMWQRRVDRAAGTAATRPRTGPRRPTDFQTAGKAGGENPRSSRSSRSRRGAAAAAKADAAKADAAKADAAKADAAKADAAKADAAKADAERRDAAKAQADAQYAAKLGSTGSRDEAARLAASLGGTPTDYLDAEALTPEPIDVNTAPASELEKLPGMTRSRARRAVKERDAQGGFTSVEDFGETVGLQPHEIVRLRRLATCSPRPRGERRFGRRVDY